VTSFGSEVKLTLCKNIKMKKKIKCLYCSEQILRTAKKCKYCGEFIDKDFRANEVADGVLKTTGSIFWKIFKIIIWLNVILFGLIFVILVLQSL